MIINKKDAQEVTQILLNINAIKLQPSNFFTWSSGKKSPIYCDNRILLSHVKERQRIISLLCKSIQKNFKSIDYIAGVATGAIAHGIMVAESLKKPFIYVRSKPKKHGRKNQIEGYLKTNKNVIVVEDLISTGKSSINAIDAIKNNGGNVIGLISIFTYGFFDLNNLNIPYFALSNYSTLINYAIENKIITDKEKEILFTWQAENTN